MPQTLNSLCVSDLPCLLLQIRKPSMPNGGTGDIELAHVPRSQERAVPAQAVGSSAESKAPGAKGAAVVDHEGSDIEVSPVGIALSVANSTANPDGVSSASGSVVAQTPV